MSRSQPESGVQRGHPVWIACLAMLFTATAPAAIVGVKTLEIDLTNATNAADKAVWSTPQQLKISEDGLGWDGEAAASRDGWIQTKPLALGLSWRPPFVISARVTIEPEPRELTLNNGQTLTPYAGDVYLRYSPDRAHWSDWQVLEHATGQQTEREEPGRRYSGTVRVPYRVRAEYNRLLSEYSALDVPWKSDEEAAVGWILNRDPDFFAQQIPFIGYVEFLYEGGFHGGRRLQSFKAEVSYVLSGLHSLPRDESTYKDRDSVPWRFQVPANAKVTWVQQCLFDLESIRPGMTRQEVEGRFPMDGGLQSASPVRFVHPKCHYFKVDVEFDFKKDAANQDRAIVGKDDKVVHVSKPYLEPPFSD